MANKNTIVSSRRVIRIHTRISFAINASININILLILIPIVALLVVLL